MSIGDLIGDEYGQNLAVRLEAEDEEVVVYGDMGRYSHTNHDELMALKPDRAEALAEQLLLAAREIRRRIGHRI